VQGPDMGAPSYVSVPPLLPGQIADVSVNLQSPEGASAGLMHPFIGCSSQTASRGHTPGAGPP